MSTINQREAKTRLSKPEVQVEKVASLTIPTPVKAMSLGTPSTQQVRRLGFMEGEIKVPDDFDDMGRTQIERLFSTGS